jgi:hypothetical protein
LDKNWAIDWQNSHTLNEDWYDCGAAHSQSLNGNQKAYAAWWLWAKLAGWGGEVSRKFSKIITVYQSYPNPFNPSTTIEFTLLQNSNVKIKVYNVLGNEVATLLDDERNAGVVHKVQFTPVGLSSGVYFYRIIAGNNIKTGKLVLAK